MDKENHFLRTELNKALEVIKDAVLILENGGINSTEEALKVLNSINDRGIDID